MVPCLPGHLPAEFMSLWSLGFPGFLALHDLLCIPICLPGFLYLLCLVLVPLLCLPVGRWSPGLTCGAMCMPAWSRMALHAFLVSCVSVVLCMSLSLWSPTPYPSPSI